MSIPLPKLDDLDYDALVEEAISIASQISDEWTSYNPSDPGIMLLELFSWLTEKTLYRLDSIPDENLIKFLRLAGVTPGETAENPDETIQEAVARAVENRDRQQGITVGDYESITADVLESEGLTGKILLHNNLDFSQYDLEPAAGPKEKDGQVSIFVIPDCMPRSYKTYVPYVDNGALQSSLGKADRFYEDVDTRIESFQLEASERLILPGVDSTAVRIQSVDESLLLLSPDAEVAGVPGVGLARLYQADETEIELTPEVDSSIRKLGRVAATASNRVILSSDSVDNGDAVIAHAVRIFTPALDGSWVQRVSLDNIPTEEYGSSLAIGRDFALVGAPGSAGEQSQSGAGSVYMYERQLDESWSLHSHIFAANAQDNERLGEALALNRNRMVLGAPGRKSVILYERNPDNTWQKNQEITSSYESFGSSVFLTEQDLFVGTGSAVLIYRLIDGDWVYESLLTPDADSFPDDAKRNFGAALYVDDELAMVGAPALAGESPASGGMVFVYEREPVQVWRESNRLSFTDDELAPLDAGFSMTRSGADLLFAMTAADGVSSGPFYKATVNLPLCSDNFIPSERLLTLVRENLNMGRLLTSEIHVRGPLFKRFRLEINVKGEEGADNTSIKENIIANIVDFYNPVSGGQDGQGYPVGRTLLQSEIIERVESAEGVDIHESFKTYLENEKGEWVEQDTSIKLETWEIIQPDINIPINITRTGRRKS